MMTNVREMGTSLTIWEAKLILALLTNECARLKRICETSDDDDEQADAGNEFMEADGLRERMEAEAVLVFGDEVKNFSRKLLTT